jgi:hypothetical protein
MTQLDHISWMCGRSLLKLTGGDESVMSPGRAALLGKINARLGPGARRGEAS